jgi:hypothetical protein
MFQDLNLQGRMNVLWLILSYIFKFREELIFLKGYSIEDFL